MRNSVLSILQGLVVGSNRSMSTEREPVVSVPGWKRKMADDSGKKGMGMT